MPNHRLKRVTPDVPQPNARTCVLLGAVGNVAPLNDTLPARSKWETVCACKNELRRTPEMIADKIRNFTLLLLFGRLSIPSACRNKRYCSAKRLRLGLTNPVPIGTKVLVGFL